MASFFKQLSDDMEKVIQVVEEGAKFMMGESASMDGEKGSDAETQSSTAFGDSADVDQDGDAAMIDDMDDMYGSPLMGMADSVMSDIMSMQVGPQTPKEHIQAFAAAITWNETFIKIIIGFHVAVIVSAVVVNRSGGVYGRLCFMFFVGIVVRLADTLNTIGAKRWREFATQNYFDGGGIFMGIMVCAPLLMVCLCMLISMIREASNLIVDVSKMKAKAQLKQKQRRGHMDKTTNEKRKMGRRIRDKIQSSLREPLQIN
ncbi:hypothetical protein ACHAXA_009416 [Cyclostephanos tholiformis]|uniref:Transmembrane protein 18 n=1 Tax=Cyclostephanos tholiformis TaxID=382380 RepID=A0ABD3R8E8_9STRA